MLGRTLKHSVIQETLGAGGMGVVYRSHDSKLQRPVALKVLSAEVTADPERRKRFLQEARAAARITHPAIAQVYDVDEADGIIFIAMELVEGKTVKELIQTKELDLLGSIDVGIQVAEGLAKAHEAGIVHRDIKPANIILTKEGHAKILDFGLAKLMAPDSTAGENGAAPADLSTLTQTKVGAVMGTAAYMSPEQVKGGTIDSRSDIFSLGVVLFEMATWQLPFRGAGLIETMHAVAYDETPSVHALRPNLPGDLQRIVARCLRKRPEDRYPDAKSLVHDLRLLRRDAESGRARTYSLRERLADTIDHFQHLTPKEYAWLAVGVVGLALLLYLILAGITWEAVFLALAALYLYRHVRNRPHQMLELFVRKVSRIPEVRLITSSQRNITVVVDQAAGQLYGRINEQLNLCNRRLFFGQPLSVAIRHDAAPADIQRMLTSTGVHYVRENVPKAT